MFITLPGVNTVEVIDLNQRHELSSLNAEGIPNADSWCANRHTLCQWRKKAV
ncbi:hypothetical protein SAMN05660860_02173 [Geoalkalibacter ferrihydriticus]|uniref:Uncharacterized protein n=1 Tax=Geoalkalibacter ferrihydriticus TaxID=392333 RepID=A0A1G9RK85_9BACT|nr:hypothetical protein SAMN05660860_02173 [Geoalkalibacter ferrihydriticus]